MGHNLKDNRIKVRVRDSCSVGYVERRISRRGVRHIMAIGLRSTVHKKRR